LLGAAGDGVVEEGDSSSLQLVKKPQPMNSRIRQKYFG